MAGCWQPWSHMYLHTCAHTLGPLFLRGKCANRHSGKRAQNLSWPGPKPQDKIIGYVRTWVYQLYAIISPLKRANHWYISTYISICMCWAINRPGKVMRPENACSNLYNSKIWIVGPLFCLSPKSVFFVEWSVRLDMTMPILLPSVRPHKSPGRFYLELLAASVLQEHRRTEKRGRNNLVPRSWPNSPAPNKPHRRGGRGERKQWVITNYRQSPLNPFLGRVNVKWWKMQCVLCNRGGRVEKDKIIQWVSAAWQSDWSNRWF